MTFSDAAKKYANETSADTGRWWTWYTNDLRAAFDAGAAHALATHTCPAEPATCCDTLEYVIENGWLCRVHSHHTCGTGPGSGYPCEPECGLEPEVDLRKLSGWPAEPERLTDPDDPRIRDGARVQYRIDASLVNGLATGATHDTRSVRAAIRAQMPQDPNLWTVTGYPSIYLLAEAPEPEPPHPDDAILAGLHRMGYNAGDLLADLRDNGLDIVRAQS